MTINLLFHSPNWYGAVTMAERKFTLLDDSLENEAVDLCRAQQRLQWWQEQQAFRKNNLFELRLQGANLDVKILQKLLGEDITAVQKRLSTIPIWLQDLAQAFSGDGLAMDWDLPQLENYEQDVRIGFLQAVNPLIKQGFSRLQQHINELENTYNKLPFDPSSIVRTLYANLPLSLMLKLSRTMVLELNIARLQSKLEGETSAARFASFLRHIRQPAAALQLLEEYPVLARQIVETVNQWVAYSFEFLTHLCTDWAALRDTFSIDTEALLIEARTGVGDNHRNGRSVIVARFDNGLKLVYKPHSLGVDHHFYNLLQWLNERGEHPPFPLLNIVTRSDHGWVEFVERADCHSREQVKCFFQRQGGYLALLYALKGTDFHYENLIAAGEHPVLVDLETLFHPDLIYSQINPATLVSMELMNHSVLRIGLLPWQIGLGEQREDSDLSGMGMKPGQLSPQAVPHWKGTGTDQMQMTKQRVEMPMGQNLVTLNGRQVSPLDYKEEIETGFEAIYRLLIHFRGELLAPSGPLAQFDTDEIRVILRATSTYAELLHESFHPDVLRDALDRERLLDHLWLEVQNRSRLSQVIPYEQRDLYNGDIPIFTTCPNSRHLWSSDKQQISNFFTLSGLELAHGRIKALSENDLEKQLWFIKASLAPLSSSQHHHPQPHRLPLAKADYRKELSSEIFLRVACSIGDRLEELAIKHEKYTTWMGLTLMSNQHWSLQKLGLDFYDGVPGVVFFLAYLGKITQQEQYKVLAKTALEALRYQLTHEPETLSTVGLFDGWGGIIYTFVHLSHLWNDPELLIAAEEIAASLSELIEQDTKLDIISGVAGCIGALRSLYQVHPTELVLNLMMQCGERLLASVALMGNGLACPLPANCNQALAGFSHGAAGMAWALLELFSLTEDIRFRQAAEDAIRYERSLFDPSVKNWKDLRPYPGSNSASSSLSDHYMMAWCHGAPGIGLARLHALQYLNNAEIQSDIDIALETTLLSGFGINHSLCHGDLGNLELLKKGHEILHDSRWADEYKRVAGIILRSIGENDWLCGMGHGLEIPGLMTGIAGIGYELLRLAESQKVPSVLLIEGPLAIHLF